jgi:hypothetical protein
MPFIKTGTTIMLNGIFMLPCSISMAKMRHMGHWDPKKSIFDSQINAKLIESEYSPLERCYQMTTNVRMDMTAHLIPHDVQACRWLHYCLDVSWMGRNVTDKAEYTIDDMHFWANVNTKFNEQLLHSYCKK